MDNTKLISLVELDIRRYLNSVYPNSNLAKSVEIDNDFRVKIAGYIENLDKGRKPRTERIPISVLQNWARRKSISLTVSDLYAIQTSIYNKGIKAKNGLIDNLDATIDNSINRNIVVLPIENEVTKIIEPILNTITK